MAAVSDAARGSQRSTKVPWQREGQQGFVAAQCCTFWATELAHSPTAQLRVPLAPNAARTPAPLCHCSGALTLHMSLDLLPFYA